MIPNMIPVIEEQLREKDKEIERLKELCDKYEEEHKTTFEEWKKTINIIKEVREYIKNHTLKYDDLMLIKPSDVLEILDKGE